MKDVYDGGGQSGEEGGHPAHVAVLLARAVGVEAFAAQVLGCVAEWPEFDPAILNPQGGAIALGHPLGASGARLAGTVAHQLARKGGGVGVATLCIGVGQGLALVLER